MTCPQNTVGREPGQKIPEKRRAAHQSTSADIMLGLFQQPQQLFDPRMMLSDPMWDTGVDTSMPDVNECDVGYQVCCLACAPRRSAQS